MFRFNTGLVLIVLLSIAGPGRAQLTDLQASLLQDGLTITADAFIVPSYQGLVEATKALSLVTDEFCRSNRSVNDVKARFKASYLAWQRISIIQIGPVMAEEGPLRFQLWPDPKGFTRRAINQAVRLEDQSLLQPGGLQGRSVALINQTALEYLIYSDLSPQTYSCDLTTAIADYQRTLAIRIAGAWAQGADFRKDYDSAVSGNERFESVDSLLRQLLAGLVVYTDRIRKFKILRGLGDETGQARPLRTEAVKSGLGLTSLAESFRTLSDIYTVPDGVFEVISDIGETAEHRVLALTALNIAHELENDNQSMESIARDDGSRAGEIRRYAQTLHYQQQYLKLGVASATGVSSGFTSADGD